VQAQTYYAVSPSARWTYGLIYLALAGFLAVMTHDVHELLLTLHRSGLR